MDLIYLFYLFLPFVLFKLIEGVLYIIIYAMLLGVPLIVLVSLSRAYRYPDPKRKQSFFRRVFSHFIHILVYVVEEIVITSMMIALLAYIAFDYFFKRRMFKKKETPPSRAFVK